MKPLRNKENLSSVRATNLLPWRNVADIDHLLVIIRAVNKAFLARNRDTIRQLRSTWRRSGGGSALFGLGLVNAGGSLVIRLSGRVSKIGLGLVRARYR